MENTPNNNVDTKNRWLDRMIFPAVNINIEKVIFASIIIIAIFTRLYLLEPRVMSHDETSHTYFSWLFYKGNGYAHDPITHGPLQFHLVALSYFLFGDSDTTARIPAAIFSIATIAFMWNYRRYLGRVGASIAAILLTISPFMLYYGRYVRNEAFVAFFAVVMIWSLLRYMDSGASKYLYIFTATVVLHFCTKETSFIYTAQALLFLALFLIIQIAQRSWKNEKYRTLFLLTLVVSVLILTAGGLIIYLSSKLSATGQPAYPALAAVPTSITSALLVISTIGILAMVYFALSGFGLGNLRRERSLDLLILLGTLVLPQLSAFAINAFGWKIPINATEVNNMTMDDILHMALIVVPIFIASILIGLWWNKRLWLINAGIWYVIYIVFYTSMFTNGAGFFTGLVGSLGYWLAQQAVNRGDQPLYYYALIQIPIYEFLPAIGSVFAILLALMGRKRLFDDTIDRDDDSPNETEPIIDTNTTEEDSEIKNLPMIKSLSSINSPAVSLLIFWSITSLLAYTVAGEKMPWLTVHITWPMILLTSWMLGYLVDTSDMKLFKSRHGWLAIGLLFIFIPAIMSTVGSLLGNNPPFAGKSLDQLAATSEFIIALLLSLTILVGLFLLMKSWSAQLIRHSLLLVFFVFLAILTARAAFTAS